ncbi:hypothetical protein DdX_17344 [Ditylenchus destructor]|uniref:Uncharacterized protein n=1 Tax=Ditylenchus destructor TaxID=166010 RepID=A0AAD4QVW2_9BILA|nr:hypothetical protein DdX_17344 [Ditylenchus destructor]
MADYGLRNEDNGQWRRDIQPQQQATAVIRRRGGDVRGNSQEIRNKLTEYISGIGAMLENREKFLEEIRQLMEQLTADEKRLQRKLELNGKHITQLDISYSQLSRQLQSMVVIGWRSARKIYHRYSHATDERRVFVTKGANLKLVDGILAFHTTTIMTSSDPNQPIAERTKCRLKSLKNFIGRE